MLSLIAGNIPVKSFFRLLNKLSVNNRNLKYILILVLI